MLTSTPSAEWKAMKQWPLAEMDIAGHASIHNVPGDLILIAEHFNAQPVAMDAHPAIYTWHSDQLMFWSILQWNGL